MPINMRGAPTSIPHRSTGSSSSSESLLLQPVPFDIVPIAGKGMGCIATRSISKGERILAERPTVEQSPGISAPLKEQINMLSPAHHAAFFQLSQNEAKWGSEKSMQGIFATNAIPAHSFARGFSAVFTTAARLNHACASNAVFKWNSNLQALTVHAIGPIAAGQEVLVSYGFPMGVVLRADRQRHLLECFGFACQCSKCTLRGAALHQSEQRLASIGDKQSMLSRLRAWGALREVVILDAGVLLGRLDTLYRLMQEESDCGADLHGMEMFLHYFVEFCDAAASRLREMVRRGLNTAPTQPGATAVVTLTFARGGPAGGGAGTGGPAGPAGGGGGGGAAGGEETACVPISELQTKARAFGRASKAWALRAIEVVRDVFGEDAPAYAAWTSAMADGCWEEEGGTFDFYERWLAAGMSAPMPPGAPGAPKAPRALPLVTSFVDLSS